MKKTKPQTAKNYHPLQKYRTLEQKHLDMKKNLKNPKLNFLEKGGFNKISQVDNTDVVIRVPLENDDKNEQLLDQKNVYNTLFIRALLKIAGEPTIVYGTTETKIDDKEQKIAYMNKGSGNMIWAYNQGKMKNLIKVLECFRTDSITQPIALYKPDPNACNCFLLKDDVDFQKLNNADLKIIARHFCKIFLFQMYDRKPENLLCFEKNKTGDKTNKLVEIDFDIMASTENKKIITVIDCIFGRSQLQSVSEMWENRIRQLYQQYEIFIEQIKKASKTKIWKQIFKETVKEYTMTEEKIVKIIQEMVRNAKYIGIDREDIIKQVQEKLSKWKYMLNTNKEATYMKDIQINIDQIDYMEDARKATQEALEEFQEKDITDIVNLEWFKQDLSLFEVSQAYSKDDSGISGKKKDGLDQQVLKYKLKKHIIDEPYKYVFFENQSSKKEKFVNTKKEYEDIINNKKSGKITIYDINGDELYRQYVKKGVLQSQMPAIRQNSINNNQHLK